METDTLVACPCGQFHPRGFICDKARQLKYAVTKPAAPAAAEAAHQHTHHEHAGHGNVHQHAPTPSCCCHDHAHAAQEAGSPQEAAAPLGEASAQRAVYRIANMDCPMEEALIRKKLANMPGITGLNFNLMQRVLTIDHDLPSTTGIEDALKSIDMTPEPLTASRGEETAFLINGMDCPEEERLIRSRLAPMPGVLALDFNLMQRVLRVRHTPEALPGISAALASLNMDARRLDTTAPQSAPLPAPHIPWKRLALAGVFAALSEGTELLQAWGAAPLGLDLSAWTVGGVSVLSCLPLLFAIVAIALSGLTTYRKGWVAVSNANLNINALMSVAVTGAVCIGQFPEAAMVMVLFNISEAIEALALDKARNAIKGLLALAPETATVQQKDGSWRDMDIRDVAVGSRVRVRPGEKIALDGSVISGQSMVNQAPITGESMPVEKTAGSPVYAGTINESGSFEFTVTAPASHSTLARIIHAVEEAQGSRAPIQRFVDTFARYYTPAVFLTAIAAALVPPLFLHSAWMDAIYTALVVLVIGCPCALVISTPVSIVSGMAAATRYGILIKGGMFLEQGRRLTCLALDKTGTITHGKPRQTDIVPMGSCAEDALRSLAASLAARSDHPVSRAIAQAAAADGIPLQTVDNFAAIPGQGIRGSIDGKDWFLGSHRMVEALQCCAKAIEEQIFRLEKQGKTVVALVGEGSVQGLFAVADTVKDSSLEAISTLKTLGVKTVMLTGDNEHTAEVIARQVGVDEFKANMLPEDKLAVIEQLEQRGEIVGMVGDGINDAPALARANIGFAMAGGGTDTAIETADVALMDDDLRKIPRFIRLSRSTYTILVQNISLALGVKALFFALTFTGHATMWMAVFADVGTALLVVANGLRAMRK